MALDVPLRAGDIAFTFAARRALPTGTGVIVPFGRRLAPGIVVGEGSPRAGLRPIIAVVGEEPLVPPAVVELAWWVAREYCSSIGEALAIATPWDALWAGIRLGVKESLPAELDPAARAALEVLRRRPATLGRAGRITAPLAPEALASITALGLFTASRSRLIVRAPRGDVAGPSPLVPDRALPGGARRRIEHEVSDALAERSGVIVLAGPHRTAAYLAAIRRAGEAGLSCVAAFASAHAAVRFAAAAMRAGLNTGLLHADLPRPTRLAVWRAAHAERPALVVGTRAAVFAPVPDPVVVIVDDDDHSGHKEERAPRYLTGAVGAERARGRGVLILGATTPSVATYARVADGGARLVALPSPRPRFAVIDLRRRPDREAAVSRPVLDAVRRVVRRRGRVILLADRKGYAGALHCRECGAVERCPQCGLAMRYERGGRLRCRVCGSNRAAPAVCSRCGGRDHALIGAGTDRITAAARHITSLVWKIDRDVLGPDEDIVPRLEPFQTRGGVLVATPVIVPWIETLRADLIAVITADGMLHRSEYRASERALAYLREIGMASRSPLMIETADPDHPALRAAVAPSLRPFYADELALRARLGYPPSLSLIALTISARSQAQAHAAAVAVGERLSGVPAFEVLGPTTQPGLSARAVLIIKTVDRGVARAHMLPLLTGEGLPRGVRITVDVDPHDLSAPR